MKDPISSNPKESSSIPIFPSLLKTNESFSFLSPYNSLKSPLHHRSRGRATLVNGDRSVKDNTGLTIIRRGERNEITECERRDSHL